MGLGFTIPNEASASFPGQADIDSIDFRILQQGVQGWGVISGCQVTQSGSGDMTVTVDPGLIQVGAQQVHVVGGVSAAFASHATLEKYALVEIHGTLGTIIRNAGTAAAAPVFPAPTTTNVVIAALWIPHAATSIVTTQIVDKRMFLGTGLSTGAKTALSRIDTTRMRP